MGDVSAGGAAGIFVGALVGGLAFATQALKAWNERKREKAYAKIGPSEPVLQHLPPPPIAATPPVVTPIEVQLQAKDVEILQLKYQLIEAQEGCRRLRRAVDADAEEMARLAAAVTTERGRADAERSRAEALHDNNQELRRQIAGGMRYEPRDRGRAGSGAGSVVRGPPGGVDTVRQKDRPAPGKAR